MIENQLLQTVIQRIASARQYTLDLIQDIDDAQWFEQPAGAATHVGWQIGHIAMAQYALCLMRVRDSQPGDRNIISRDFRKHFGKGTSPDPDPENNPPPDEIRQVFAAVHHQVLEELPTLDPVRLAEPLAQPHPMFDTRMGALNFSADHEYLHAGQIGLLRRLLGKEPLR